MAAERSHPLRQIKHHIVRQLRLIAALMRRILPSNFKYAAEDYCPLDQTASGARSYNYRQRLSELAVGG